MKLNFGIANRFACFAVVLLSFVNWPAYAADYLSHQLEGRALSLTTTEGQVKLTAISEHGFEVHYLTGKPFPSFALDRASIEQQNQALVEVVDDPERLIFTTGLLSAVIEKSPFSLSYYKSGQLLTSEQPDFEQLKTAPSFRFSLMDKEKLLGTGERVLGMDRRGHRLPLYNRAHYGYTTHSEQMNFSIPAVISDKKYLVLFDNSANGWVDLGKTEADVLQFDAVGGRHSYIILAGDTYPELIHHYVDVTGKQPLPPRWALGNHASRFGYRSQQQVLETIAKFRSEDIPVDSVILDLYWFGKDIKGHMGNLDWDFNAFPEPDKMIDQLKQDGVNTVLITEPFILTSSKTWQQALEADVFAKDPLTAKPKTYDFYFGHTGLVDVFNDKAKDWFGSVYKRLAKQGVTGVWGDLGEPEVHPADIVHTLSEYGNLSASGDEIHNAFGHQWGRMVNDTLNEYAPEQRQFMVMRSGFAGSQRYGMIPWTGDVSRSWGGLKGQVELSLQMSMLGMAYTHSDLGGFAGGEVFDQEMYLRWLQYGVFQPIYRPHAQDNIAPEPVFHDEQTKDIIREYIKLRYRLLPYLYTLAYENSTTGMPLMRPMFFNDESNADLIAVKDQYFWGDSFLVKPVTDPDLESIEVSLPSGNWFNYWDDTRYQGGQSIAFPLTLETIPVLVKAGAIIPSVDAVSSTRDYSSQRLQLDYYFDDSVPQSSAKMYEDDGQSSNTLAKKHYELLNFAAKYQGNNNALTIHLERSASGKGYQGMPERRTVELVIHNWQEQNHGVLFNQQEIKAVNSVEQLAEVTQGAFYKADNKTLTVKAVWDHSKTALELIKR